MTKPIKITIISIVSIILVIGIAFGIITIAKSGSGTVNVYAVSEFSMSDYWGDSSQTYGFVKADKIQSVYTSSTQQITQIAVDEGQEVHAGDLLLSYDTTLSDIELKKAEISLQKLQLQLENAKKELAVIKTYKPYVIPTPTPEPEPEPEPLVPVVTPYLYGGTGTEDDPYIYVWGANDTFTPEFIGSLAKEPGTVYAVFAVCEEDSLAGEVINHWGIRFDIGDNGYNFSFFDADTPDFGKKDTSSDTSSTDTEQGTSYTAAEIAKMKADKEKEIRDTDIAIQLAQVNYEKMKKEVSDGNVYANIDGTVTSVLDAATALANSTPVLVVSGGGGYYIEGGVSELELDNIAVGQEVQVSSWETGETYYGTVSSVSTTPSENSGYSNGNPNVSYYVFTVFIDGSANLQEGQYVDMQYSSSASSGNSLYLQNPFIITENGKNYVYVRNDEGVLEKRELTTGKMIWGEYTQILSGLTADDYIAFPYGSSVKEGAKTMEGSTDELYGY